MDDLPFAKPSKKKRQRKRYVKAMSDRRRQRMALYKIVRSTYTIALAKGQGREDPLCERCEENVGTQIHHIAGRRGNDLYRPENLALLCTPCHTYIHDHPAQAADEGFMKPRYLQQSTLDPKPDGTSESS